MVEYLRYLCEMFYTGVGGWRFRWARFCHPCADDRRVIKTGMVYDEYVLKEIVLLTRLQWCTGAMHMYSLVENYAKKNRSRFPIAVLLTTLLCSHLTTTKIYFSFCDCKCKCVGVCDIPLERHFQDLSNDMLQAQKYVKCHSVTEEKQICSCLSTAEQGGQKNRNGQNDCGFFFRIVFY